jgi:hypothetical protein
MGIPCHESELSISKTLEDIEQGKITEAFAAGTAVIVNGIRRIVRRDGSGVKEYALKNGETNPMSKRLYD